MRQIRVTKVGGSLFELPALSEHLLAWLGQQSAAKNVLLAGGGGFVEQLRRLHRTHALAESTSHWLAVGAMHWTARFLYALLDKSAGCNVALVDDVTQIAATPSSANQIWIFDPERWLHAVGSDPTGRPLPESWEVTSDSIAARVAHVLNAQELVLLKSSLPSAAQAGGRGARFVDAFFHQASQDIPVVRCVDLRSGGEERLVRR